MREKERKERKTRYTERRVIKQKENARICLLCIPCLQYGGHNRNGASLLSKSLQTCGKMMYRIKFYFISLE
jgi:alpha/beta superfamily hydrolase